MATAINYFGNNQDFYPTPARLIDKMLRGLEMHRFQNILEPSAGKGDLADGIKSKIEVQGYSYRDTGKNQIDTIEIDENLRHVLKGKEYKVVHDDFLTYDTARRYDLIVMNPPFSRGEWHLLKALDMLKNGGKIVCLLNAETLKNLFSNPRRDLSRRLGEYNAEIEYLPGAFADAERPTGVEIALIKVTIPEVKRCSHFFDELKLKSEESYRARTRGQELTQADFIENLVERYNVEVKAGIRLIEEYAALKPQILESMKEHRDRPIIKLEIEGGGFGDNLNQTINAYVKKVRYKYWENLFSAKEFICRCTSNMQNDLFRRIEEMTSYDFSRYNINQIKIELIMGMSQAAEQTILKIFNDLSDAHAYNDFDSKNIHYYNGWKTNKSWIINKKVIIPMYGAFSEWNGQPEFSRYRTLQTLSDIEKALDYLDQGETTTWGSLESNLQRAEKDGITRNIDTKHFTMTFYKKGTCHLTFKDLDLLKKLNIFGSQKKGWLPPAYGKKTYSSMDAEEKAVIDEFEGEKEYARTLNETHRFITASENLLRIAS